MISIAKEEDTYSSGRSISIINRKFGGRKEYSLIVLYIRLMITNQSKARLGRVLCLI